jgi:hypothetical protein
MSSVKAIRALLAAAADVTARVPADRIVAGGVKEDTALPALGLTEVSSVPVGAFDAQAEYSVVTSRVQVTVMVERSGYPEMKALLDLVRRACNFQRGQLAGVDVISVVRDTVGPDLEDMAGNHFQSIDFKVTYHEKN